MNRGRDEMRVVSQRDPSTHGVAGLESEEHASNVAESAPVTFLQDA